LARPQANDDPVEQVEVLIYRAELANASLTSARQGLRSYSATLIR
jgi:hypothetical protein